ncbi:unnamed protein product [Cuscuta campestris]|uniref:Pentacotripeptide-repeat region of PRORP domain-containing protein n=1 Tax=Cuscuta campestris TaxID=132261 RepID=A0A484LM65_9ASTE|nr:unnamed protein product [Cuscuta campestris]
MHLRPFISRRFSTVKQTDSPSNLNSYIRELVQKGRLFEALQCYSREPSSASRLAFPAVLKACASLLSLGTGRAVHATVFAMGFQFDPYIAASLVNMYVKCGSIRDAEQVFDNIPKSGALSQDVTLWNAMIDGYFKNGFRGECLAQFRQMQALGINPDGYTLSILLGVSSRFSTAKEIHGYAIRSSFEGDPFIVTALVDMYANCGRAVYAWRLFESQECKNKNNVVIWNAMMNGFCKTGFWSRSLELYSLIRGRNQRIMPSMYCIALTACCDGEDFEMGRQVHTDIVKTGVDYDQYVHTSLLTMYAKCGSVGDAEKVFNDVVVKGIETWNAMVSAYVGNGWVKESFIIYNQMKAKPVSPDSFTISNILTSCGIGGFHDFGTSIHAELIKRPVQTKLEVQSALMTMYLRCCKVEDAIKVFNRMEEKDVVAWGSMMSGFYQNKKYKESVGLYKQMLNSEVKPDSNMLSIAINATSVGIESIELGSSFFGVAIKHGLESDAFVGSSLMDLFSKSGQPEMAKTIFFGISNKNLVVWNSLISCYSRNSHPDASVRVLPQIVQYGLIPDAISVTNALVAVSSLAVLLKGKALHGYLIRYQIPVDNQVENSLIDMYIKSGCLKYAEHIFNSNNTSKRNSITWNSMISGYGSHGECFRAISLFNEMRRSRITPDDVTFLSLISACNHSGLVEEGLELFQLMREYRVEPQTDHYVNIVDMLGRTGRLDEAHRFIQKMPVEPDPSLWLCLLSACRVHRNFELGELAAQNLLKIEAGRGGNYVQVLNLYVEGGMREKAADLRAEMKQKGLKKTGGCSWIEVKDRTEIFFSGDSSSHRTVEVYQTLHSLISVMKMEEKGDYHESC